MRGRSPSKIGPARWQAFSCSQSTPRLSKVKEKIRKNRKISQKVRKKTPIPKTARSASRAGELKLPRPTFFDHLACHRHNDAVREKAQNNCEVNHMPPSPMHTQPGSNPKPLQSGHIIALLLKKSPRTRTGCGSRSFPACIPCVHRTSPRTVPGPCLETLLRSHRPW